MSYGFYKMPPKSSPRDYVARVAGRMPVAFGVGWEVGNEQPQGVLNNMPDGVLLEPPRMADTLLGDKVAEARAQGYSGSICIHCQGTRMKWAGHCEVCDDCGTTTGCS